MVGIASTAVGDRLRLGFRLKFFALAATLIASAPAHALDVNFGDISGTLNTNLTFGAQMRMESQAKDLIGKSDLDPNVCGVVNGVNYQSCQAVFRDQIFPAQKLVAAPGASGMRADDGDLNYDKHDLTQAVAMAAQDLTLHWGDYGLFARWLYFYDFVNNDFMETRPNIITAENAGNVGITGDREANRYFTRVYGAGGREKIKRSDGEILREVGTDFQLMDINIFGKLPLWGDKEINWKIGRQNLNWGESTTLVVNSLNQINPPNANNLYRTGMQLDQVFQPVGMVTFSGDAFANIQYEVFYQFEWRPLEAPAPGSYMSFADLGTNYARDFGNLSFGGSADDPDGVGHPLDSPLALITPTTARAVRDPDREPSNGGQYGFSLKYYAENINSGTEFGFYFMNYHSRLPYVSFKATDASCARREGNPYGNDAHNTLEFFRDCGNLPAYNTQSLSQVLSQAGILIAQKPGVLTDLGGNLGGLLAAIVPNPDQPLSDAVPLSTGRVFFEYPEDIQLYGWSFNTAYGDYSFQGEVAYRPNLPLQVAITDLEFAAAGPTLTRCHDVSLDCAGTTGGRGIDASGNLTTYGSSDFLDANGNNPFPDTVNLIVGGAPGSARSFPSFVVPYRGGTLGETAPNSYIRGYERFDVLQYNLGVTRVLSGTENWFGADQIQLVGEVGATHVPGLPAYDRLQIESPGVYYHASAGADGSGANGSKQACSTNPTCSIGPDGARFNPHQANLDDLVDKFSWGYRLIAIIKYESVLPGISLSPFILFGHDVNGTAPGPAENFVEDRKQAQLTVETRYRDALSFTVGYSWFWGGGYTNVYRDRDFAQAYVRYQF
jgi:hypothetical protein